jgi:aminoglycoside/choline kinase family phosphotransferase
MGCDLWPSAPRKALFDRWLQSLVPAFGLLPASTRLASADASFRRYLRVDSASGTTFVVMDAPPEREDSESFVRIAALMASAGVKVPRVFDWHAIDGFLLLEDLGTRTMIDALDRSDAQANQNLYMQAVDQMIALQRASRPDVLPPYDEALLRRELALFPDWYLGRYRGVTLNGAQRATLEEQFALIVQHNLASPAVFVHRDFMPRNLMLLPATAAEPDATTSLGVLDFQDAVHGPVTYDIASLMRDAFISWDEEFVLDITVRYWQRARSAALPVDPDFGEFYQAVEWMGLQRHLKVAGIFARLSLRDGKPRYLADTPRFIGYIRATASRYRELKPLLRLLDAVEGTEFVQAYAFGRS